MTPYDKLVQEHGEAKAKQIMSERSKMRKSNDKSYFAVLKREGKTEELKNISRSGGAVPRVKETKA
jgi:hypothetical protein